MYIIFQYLSKKSLIAEVEDLTNKIVEIKKQNQAILDNSPVCTKIIDLDYNLQFMSASGVRDLDIDDITEFYGKPYPLEFYPQSFKDIMIAGLDKCKETGEIITQEAPVVDLNRNTMWFHSTITPIDDNEGNLDYFLVVSYDITKFKVNEKISNG
ncbi:MAG: hypothetical protein COA45_02180 [Zetaproteobacteria bacterium]|nr:MAG: hypothetical protein COA45_02180 [Zetaproteobacteria bacterium]